MWSIENQCPQCGSPVTIEETDRIFACRFCRVRLFIAAPDHLRYYLPSEGPRELIYVPYWRLKGISFSVVPYDVSHALVDGSLIACKTMNLPRTMGLRPQTLKLRFVSPDLKGEMIKPQFQSREASSRISEGLTAVEKVIAGIIDEEAAPRFTSAFIGETASLIYTPFYIRDNGLFDAVTGQRVAGQAVVDEFLSGGHEEGWQARFLPTLCPNCGADLAGDRRSMTLFCNGCYSAWEAGSEGLSRVEFGIMPGGNDPAHLPFWRIRADIEGMELKSFGDLARAANLPRVIKTEWDSMGLYFWQPAFKVNPPLYLRLAREVTLKQPQTELETRLELRKSYPVTLAASEVAESIKISLASIVSRKKEVFPILKDLDVKAAESLLVYIPFEQKMTELVQTDMGFSILKSAVDMGGNL